MKLIYCIHSICNPGGMERVLWNKVTYWTRHTDWQILIVTTDQQARPAFYPFPEQVRCVDLGINYSDDNAKRPAGKILGYLKRRRIHRQRLKELLMRERADIVVSLYPSESSFIPDIRDGSKKVLELHFCKFFRLQYGRKGVLGLIDRWRTRQDERIVRRFDRFVVLTEEDRGYWGTLPNLEVIPNAVTNLSSHLSDGSAHRVIAVGRLDYQKGSTGYSGRGTSYRKAADSPTGISTSSVRASGTTCCRGSSRNGGSLKRPASTGRPAASARNTPEAR